MIRTYEENVSQIVLRAKLKLLIGSDDFEIAWRKLFLKIIFRMNIIDFLLEKDKHYLSIKKGKHVHN